MKKFTYGTPFETDAVVERVERTEGDPSQFTVERTGDAFVFRRPLSARDRVYGLGEQVRGINKRGWLYDGWNTDDPRITEGRTALYGAHNFIVLTGEETFGVFFDSAGRVVFDVGYEDPDELKITAWNADVYVIEGGSAKEVVHTFRTLIGRSYIPPKWAFGYGQSKWGYKTEEDIRAVVEGYRANGFPLDAVYMDIDYMIHYKDFTVDPERYPDLSALSAELKAEGIYLVPIVDAAIKAEEGYPVYDEGLRNGYFCTDAAGVPYVVGVWPGDSVLPDVLAPEARAWFGAQYRALLDEGIEGFWNDMNEPALFYGKERLQKAIEAVAQTKGNLELDDFNKLTANFGKLANSPEDYRALCHNVNGKRVSHADVHNLYGYNMTRAAAEYFAEYAPDKRFLLFSRSSCIGMHRYGGIWTGDNCSWWSHLLLNVKMMPSLDMCGFLFAGADIGGHADNTTEELLLRWLAFGIFTPLMRNHATNGARDQECYRFKNKDAFRRILGMRYALLPYLYSEYIKCALRGEMLFKPLAFEYPEDARADGVEDQLFFGESLMIAPVCEQNAKGRYVYLPARMKMIRMRAGDDYKVKTLEKGSYYLEVPLDEVVFFLREGKVLPLARPAQNVASLDEEHLAFVKFIDSPVEYEICRDDGSTLSGIEKGLRKITVRP